MKDVPLTGFVQILKHCFPGLAKTKCHVFPGLERTFHDTICSQIWLHEVKKWFALETDAADF